MNKKLKDGVLYKKKAVIKSVQDLYTATLKTLQDVCLKFLITFSFYFHYI